MICCDFGKCAYEKYFESGKVHCNSRAAAQELKAYPSAVIQPSLYMLTRSEQTTLVKQANDELTIRHTAIQAEMIKNTPCLSPKLSC
jgi:hypothetical protein